MSKQHSIRRLHRSSLFSQLRVCSFLLSDNFLLYLPLNFIVNFLVCETLEHVSDTIGIYISSHQFLSFQQTAGTYMSTPQFQLLILIDNTDL